MGKLIKKKSDPGPVLIYVLKPNTVEYVVVEYDWLVYFEAVQFECLSQSS